MNHWNTDPYFWILFFVAFVLPLLTLICLPPFRTTKGSYHGKWWHAAGSDKRYNPKPWERKAYAAGLRDALRIGHTVINVHWHATVPARDLGAEIGQAIHKQAKLFESDGKKPCRY